MSYDTNQTILCTLHSVTGYQPINYFCTGF
uniref:Uncharacterized protein n=1 Tax=Anguilla anguilla TaxID=7936 RepID=A0A0E9SV56_ANGAN